MGGKHYDVSLGITRDQGHTRLNSDFVGGRVKLTNVL
jgi:hypothetical protein